MKKFIGSIQTLIISIIFWCLLNENFRLNTLLVGLIIASIMVFLLNFLFSVSFIPSQKRPNPVQLLLYVLQLFKNIYLSAFRLIPLIFKKNIEVTLTTVPTKAQDELSRVLIANGITLTPGTLTIDVDKNELLVLWLDPKPVDPEQRAHVILGDFERALMK